MATPERARFLKSVQEMRRIFEPEAAALAAVHRDSAQMAAISDACRDMGTATTIESRIEADVRFHLGILSAASNEFLVPFGFLIESALANVFDYVTRSVGTLRHAQSLHENIEKAIRHRRPEAARRAARLLLADTDGIIEHLPPPAERVEPVKRRKRADGDQQTAVTRVSTR
jgi:DNA-binding FadR family transcriptional regulator